MMQARCVETIRLLSLCSLASGNKTLSFDAIATTLQVRVRARVSVRLRALGRGSAAAGRPAGRLVASEDLMNSSFSNRGFTPHNENAI